MKKLLSVCLCAVLIICMAPTALAATLGSAATVGTWTSGDTTVTLDSNGVMTVTGNGAMEEYTKEHAGSAGTNYDGNDVPWCASRASVTSIVIDSGVTAVDGFYDCYNATSLTFNEPCTLTTIYDRAFNGCDFEGHLQIPYSVTTMGFSAFRGCSFIQSLFLPSTVTSIGSSVFDSCVNLSDVVLDEGITELGDYIFSGCYALTSIKLPSTLKKIGVGAFQQSGITSIEFPLGLERIEASAFYESSLGGKVYLPDSIEFVGPTAFFVTNVTDVYFLGSAPEGIYQANYYVSTGDDPIWNDYPSSEEYDWWDCNADSFNVSEVTGKADTILHCNSAYQSTFTGIVEDDKTIDGTTYDTWKGYPIVCDTAVVFDSQEGNAVATKYFSSGNASNARGAELSSSFNIADAELPARPGYIFTGWYYDEACTEPVAKDTYFSSTTTLVTTSDKSKSQYDASTVILYAGWREIDDTGVAKANDNKYTGKTTYSEFDLFGTQIRSPELENDGLRFVTVLGDTLKADVEAFYTGAGDRELEYGYISGKKSSILSSTCTGNVSKEFTSCASIIDCTVGKNGVVRDHGKYTGYRIYSLVINYDNPDEALSEQAKLTDVMARAYLTYLDANGNERTYYSDYTGASVIKGACFTSYNKALSAVEGVQGGVDSGVNN